MKKYTVVIIVSALFLLPVLLGIYTCPVWAVVGIPCPACGMTRAAVSLLHLDLAGAWQMHPGIFVLIIWSALVMFSWLKKGTLWKNTRFHIGFVVVFLLIYIFRMIFLFPHTEPMLHNARSLLYRLYCAIFGFALY